MTEVAFDGAPLVELADDTSPVTAILVSPSQDLANSSSAPITDWPGTPSISTKREALASFVKCFPGVNEDILILILEEFNYDNTLAWDTIILPANRNSALDSLFDAFPHVSKSVVKDAWSERPGQYINVFYSLVLAHHPLWRPTAPKTSALSLSPPPAATPTFIAEGTFEQEKEADWWKSLVNTARWQVTDPEPDSNTWRMVSDACRITDRSYSPRLASRVGDLLSDGWKAPLLELSILPAYSSLCDLAGDVMLRVHCRNIVSVLASHGMVAPGALAWAFEVSQHDPDSFRGLRDSISDRKSVV